MMIYIKDYDGADDEDGDNGGQTRRRGDSDMGRERVCNGGGESIIGSVPD